MSARISGLEVVQKSGIVDVQTSASGDQWVQLPSTSCAQVVIHNHTGTTLRVRYCSNLGAPRGGEGSLLIEDGIAQPLRGLTNASQLQIQRHDQSGTQVTAQFVFELP